MDKNILVIGASRSGKTSLARIINKELGYSIVSLDDIICGFESFPELGIHHDGNDVEVAQNFSKFLKRYLVELSEGPNYYGGCKYVIEGTHIDFEDLMPFIKSDKLKDKYEIIGLTYNYISEEDLYNNIKNNDTEDDWTFYCSDEELRGNVKYFLDRNKFFSNKFKKYGISSYDTSKDRQAVLSSIIIDITNNENKLKR